MSSEIRRLTVADRNELAEVLNYSFTSDKNSGYFETGLPKMWINDSVYIPRHFAVCEKGKMIAALGVYPYTAEIAGEQLRFATVGNIATMPEARGKGCMRSLLTAAMQELEDLEIEVSRLGGLRSRYARWGYENCGSVYQVSLTKRNAQEFLERDADAVPYTFQKITETSTDELAFIRHLYEKNALHVKRGDDRCLYATLCAWGHIPYMAYREREPVGYLCVSPDGKHIAEQNGCTPQETVELLCQWVQQGQEWECAVSFYPWTAELGRLLGEICETVSVTFPSKFKVIHWDKLTYSLLKLKSRLHPLPEGEAVIGIDGWGSMRLTVARDGVCCIKTDERPDIQVDPQTAARLLYGPLSPELCVRPADEKMAILTAWLPLPLSWNDQDRL